MKKSLKSILRKNKKVGLIVLLILGAVLVYEYINDHLILESNDSVQLVRCVDGDTAKLSVDGKEETVRFLAVDTPETKHPTKGKQPFGEEASNMTCDLLTNAKEIKLEYESSNKTDKYERILAWVWLDGTLLQQELIENGLAEVKYIYGDYKYTSKLQALQEEAKRGQVGIWK